VMLDYAAQKDAPKHPVHAEGEFYHYQSFYPIKFICFCMLLTAAFIQL